LLALVPSLAAGLSSLSESGDTALTGTTLGIVSLLVFALAYLLVVLEEPLHLRKSKPVVLAAGLIWTLTAFALRAHHPELSDKEFGSLLEGKVLHHAGEYGALFLFLLVAMTYISAISRRNVFLALNAKLISAGFSLRSVFWLTGTLAFFISPVADNMTTALLMGAVATTVGRGNPRFITVACINIVIAANAGGAFSPFGDITTLMVWAAGKVEGPEFLKLFLPCVANWLVPAFLMSLAIERSRPAPNQQDARLLPGWATVIGLFLATIVTAVLFHSVLHIPPFLGMMTGLGYLMIWGWINRRRARHAGSDGGVDVFDDIAEVEWDTMLFFFGVILCVGALGELGYLALASGWLYGTDGSQATIANIGIGVISAVIDNVPVMFAVLGMNPVMGATAEAAHYQWLLVTLTAGVGGSLLSVGSAAGVALMGTARGQYTFFGHLRWTPAIALGYAASIVLHALLNGPST
jgi:Na+/H+ antiporter NhaD/arsenite permease-like protein